MKITISELKKKDYGKAIAFAITGMHFHWYIDNTWLVHLYGRYFWYLEMTRATQVIAAYAGQELAGVLLAKIQGEAARYRSLGKTLYVKAFALLQRLFAKGGAGVYDKTNQELFAQYRKNNVPDGEILFLAANPHITCKGVGSALLQELTQRARGKKLYLYTDSACTYQFYEHRGFARACEKEIMLQIGSKKTPLRCFLYSKTLE